MSLIKRIAATVYAQVDQTVSQIENHDAVIQSAIKQIQRAASRTKVRLSRVKADGERLRRQLAELTTEQAHWAERAKRVAGNDRETALQCLSKRQTCRQQIGQLEIALQQHDELSQKLASEYDRVESHLRQIKDQRNLMRTRESAADAVRMLSALDCTGGIDIEDTLERWEIRITEAEMQTGQFDEPVKQDALDRRFLDEEQRDALDAELQQLMKEDERHG